VIFIDTENSFNIDRVRAMHPTLSLDNIVVIRCRRYSEQFAAVKRLSEMKNLSLVIVDSFTKYYRKKLQEKVTIRPPTIRMLTMLKELHVPVVVTSQVYTGFDGKIQPIARDLFKRFAVYSLRLEKSNGTRTLLIEQTGVVVPFIVTDAGLTV